jgi:DNA-directed RNA polymerase II subunit RPB1
MTRRLTKNEIDEILQSLETFHPDPNFVETNNNEMKIDPSHNFVIETSRRHTKRQLEKIEIYPEAIPALTKEIIRQYNMSFITPGEMVGCIAATSIGSETSQEALNSFHASGQRKENLTSGVPRFKELIDLSKEMKTPMIEITFHEKYNDHLREDNPDSLRFFRELMDTQIKHVRMDDLIKKFSIDINPKRDWWYTTFNLLYSDAHRSCTHRIRLHLDPEKMWKCKKDMGTIAAKIERQVNTKGLMHIAFSDNYTAQMDIWVNNEMLSGCEEALMSRDVSREDLDKILVHITEDNKAEICLRNVVLPQIRQTDISGVPGVTQYYSSEKTGNGKSPYKGETRGGSLVNVLGLDCVDPRKCRSNNVHEIYKLFGIEAAQQFLVKEFKEVSKVTLRHLQIMTEWMCVSGRLLSVNRHGQEISKIGPIAKASFEQPLDAFIKAASNAQLEVITGVSASIATGNLPKIGTGSFQMLLDVNKLIQEGTIAEEQAKIDMIYEEEEPIEIMEDLLDDTSGTEDPNFMYRNLDEEEII